MNILLTCVGRRSYMVEYFREALGKQGCVIATNSVPNTAGMMLADKSYIVPRVDNAEYIHTLLRLCKQERISALISLFDIDLPYLAAAREEFEEIGVKIWVSSSNTIEIANDKWSTHLFLKKNNIITPWSEINIENTKKHLKSGKIHFPIVVKPRYGMGSMAIFIAENIKELNFLYAYSKKNISRSYLDILSNKCDSPVLFQEFIEGAEYGLDVFNSYAGQPLSCIVKEKLEMRSGETDRAITIKNETLQELGLRIGALLHHRGNLDIDVIFNKETNESYVLELNARFGGGYPFSHIAGVNFPLAIIKETCGESIPDSILRARPGVLGLKILHPEKFEKEIAQG